MFEIQTMRLIMKKISLIFGFCLIVSTILVATTFEDVVYLKNGEIVRGLIIEEIPNKSITIQTFSNNIFIYQIEDIEKIKKEELTKKRSTDIDISDREISIGFGNGIISFPKGSNFWIAPFEEDKIGINTFNLRYSSLIKNNIYYAGLFSFGFNKYLFEGNNIETNENFEANIIGFSAEFEIFCSNYLSSLSNTKLFYGINLGYYDCTNTIDDTYDLDGETYNAMISGFAQSFILGYQIDLTSNLSMNIKFQKLGFSLLKLEVENPFSNNNIAYSKDIVTSPDLKNLGISISLSYKL